MQEPAIKRAVVFIDGQNLFHSAKAAFGYHEPTYDVRALATSVCAKFPQSSEKRLNKGIYGTDWIPVDAVTYAACVESTPFYPVVPAGSGRPT
jgi:hypothetical protein